METVFVITIFDADGDSNNPMISVSLFSDHDKAAWKYKHYSGDEVPADKKFLRKNINSKNFIQFQELPVL